MKQFAFVLLSLVLTGCAIKPRVDRNRDWSAFIGNYSFEQAVAELGRPYLSGEQSDGSRFGEWILQRSPQISFGIGVGGGSIGRHSSVGVSVGTSVSPPPHGEYLHLDFGTNGMLTAWTKTRH